MAAKDRPPSFQFYPREYLSSRAVCAMHPTARGGYVHLLCHAWLSDRPGWLPDDDTLLSAISGLGERWRDHRESIARAWRIRKGWWVQPRMVESRRAQKRRWKRSSAGAKATNESRWGATESVAPRLASDSRSVSPSSAFAFALRTKEGELLPFEDEAIRGFRAAYPGVTIEAEFPKMAVWLMANGHKTRRGTPRFVNGWLARAQKQVVPLTPVRLSMTEQLMAEALERTAR